MRNKGFSLIELILVMLLIAIVSAGVSIVVSNFSTSQKSLYTFGEHLYEQMRFAQEEALISQRVLGLRIDKESTAIETDLNTGKPTGYSWHYYQDSQWHTFGEPLTSISLHDDIALTVSVEDVLLEALQEEQLNNLTDTQILPPAVIFFPHGEISQFTINLSLKDNKEDAFRIYLNDRGELYHSLLNTVAQKEDDNAS